MKTEIRHELQKALTGFLWAVIILTIPPVIFAKRTCLEPLPHRNQLPTSAVFLEPEPLSPCTTPQGAQHWRGSMQWSNTSYEVLEHGYELVIDHERWDNQVTVRHGLSSTSDIGLRFGAVHDGGGIGDTTISRFHRRVRYPEYERVDRPRSGFEIIYNDPFHNRYYERQNTVDAPTEPVISYRQKTTEIPLPWVDSLWVGWRGDLKLPLGDTAPLVNSSRPDAALGIMTDTGKDLPFGRVGFNLQANIVALGKSQSVIFQQRHYLLTGSGTLGLKLFDKIEIVTQWLSATQRYEHHGIGLLDRSQHIHSNGVRYWWKNHLLSFAFTEDPAPSSEDVSFLFAWQYLPK